MSDNGLLKQIMNVMTKKHLSELYFKVEETLDFSEFNEMKVVFFFCKRKNKSTLIF